MGTPPKIGDLDMGKWDTTTREWDKGGKHNATPRLDPRKDNKVDECRDDHMIITFSQLPTYRQRH